MPNQTASLLATRQISGLKEIALAIDEVISLARRRIRIFDRNLAEGGYNTPERFNRLKVFLLGSRQHRLEIAVHNTDYLERDCARMVMLLRQFPYAVSVHRTLEEARRVHDAFIVVDETSYVHRFHADQPRGEVAFANEANAGLLVRRFQEIWTLSEPALSATVLGL